MNIEKNNIDFGRIFFSIAIGIAVGYILEIRFGHWSFALIGGLLAFFASTPIQAFKDLATFTKGIFESLATHSPKKEWTILVEKLNKEIILVFLEKTAKFFLKIILFCLVAIISTFRILSLLSDVGINNVQARDTLFIIFASFGIFSAIFVLMVFDTPVITNATNKTRNPYLWLIFKKIFNGNNREVVWQKTYDLFCFIKDKICTKEQYQEKVLLSPHRLLALFLIGLLSTYTGYVTIVSLTLFLFTIVIFVIDFVLSCFLLLAKYENVTALICASIGAFVEYLIFPSFEGTFSEIARFVLFSFVGGLIGVGFIWLRKKIAETNEMAIAYT